MLITLTLSLSMMIIVLVGEIGKMSAGKKILDIHTAIRLILFIIFLFLEIVLMLFTAYSANPPSVVKPLARCPLLRSP